MYSNGEEWVQMQCVLGCFEAGTGRCCCIHASAQKQARIKDHACECVGDGEDTL